jgi:hypothetical protein
MFNANNRNYQQYKTAQANYKQAIKVIVNQSEKIEQVHRNIRALENYIEDAGYDFPITCTEDNNGNTSAYTLDRLTNR